jgi:hypothetical protein
MIYICYELGDGVENHR